MAAVFSFFSALLGIKDIEFIEARNPEFESLKAGIIPMTLTLVLRNPNNIAVDLESFSFELSCKGRKAGTSLGSAHQTIEANATFELQLQLDLFSAAVRELVRDELLQIITDGTVKLPIDITGHAKLKKFGVPFEVPFKLQREFDLSLDTLLKKIKL